MLKTMTKEQIIDEMKTISTDARAVEFALGRLEFDKLMSELEKSQKSYLKFVKNKEAQLKKKNASLEERVEALISADYNELLHVHDIKSYYYERAYNFDSEVMIEFEQWSQSEFDEIECKYEEYSVEDYLKENTLK